MVKEIHMLGNQLSPTIIKYFCLDKKLLYCLIWVGTFSLSCQAQESDLWIKYAGKSGPGEGKNIVLVSGDDEYRSEEALPMLAKILSERYGFNCTVLFAIDPETGEVTPNYQKNIPGLEQLATADLMIMFLRFRDLPDSQMKHIDAYVRSGKPIIGLRTSTHAFNFSDDKNSSYAKYGWRHKGGSWEGGFGRQVLGETWVSHHGHHGKEGTRALIDGINQAQDHPIVRGVKDIWGPTDVYTVKNLPDAANVLAYGQSTRGMSPEAELMWEKALMPIAWTLNYTGEDGKTSKIFSTTMGASEDLESRDLRRMIINASFWCLGMENEVKEDMNVDYVGEYHPTKFGFDNFKRGLKPADFR